MRQGEHRDRPAHRLAVALDQLQPQGDRMGDTVAKPQACEVGGGQALRQLPVLGVVPGERQVDAAAGKGDPGEAGVHAGFGDGRGEGLVGPAVEGDMRQRMVEHRAAQRDERVLFGQGVSVIDILLGILRFFPPSVVDSRVGFGYIAPSCRISKHMTERW